ncbi:MULTISPECIES: YtzI protein [Bacillus]|uniref:YtzI protein n=1 Tax=Bacillus glycinifermentans TaxID=1664069 RepID=A0AAJ4D3I9_9BACI|nr:MULTISPECIES: YtzI protein [Bacillus]MBU8788886.1 YtzI protein [Bacillus glycinifermentans]MDU0073628.1 YtzI protein [Bacillus sp. IG6]MED8021500.1 YtzI protein [Bacillus glycinifermentans]NUJ17755.1 YtzI protein [Bacillus glycinifermentans]QAT66615.1 YtzI protein [Bacillus glycinifermentans]
MIFWIVAGFLITGIVLALSLVTTSKAYDFQHRIDPPPPNRRIEEERPDQ